jgi:hypothetical protein
MKPIYFLALAFLATAAPTFADTIAQWTFNSVPSDGMPTTGTNGPSVGSGTASLVGGITASFSTGSTNDPASGTDDSGWQTTDYPVQGNGNKTAGVQFDVNTAGYSNIVVRWDHRVTSTASKYYRLRYTTDGNTFIDYPSPITMTAAPSSTSYYETQTNSFAATSGANNNPNFAFRIVSEFEISATGSGSSGYVTVSNSTYSPGANVRFDYVTVLGTLIPGGNTPPTISGISNQTIRVNQSTGPLSFTVLDAEDPAANLTLSKVSSDTAVVPLGNIVFGGSGASRTVNVTAANQAGSSTTTVWVIDTGGKSNSTAFVVTVLPANTAPVISIIAATNALINTATAPIPFTVGDAETPAASLTLSGSSANTALVPNANILFGGSGSNRTVTVTPAAGQIGVAPITVTVSDGTNIGSSVFGLMVTPSTSVIFFDPFVYANGSLLTNSGFLWDSRSGTEGQCQVTNGQLLLVGATGEDVDAPLVGAPFHTGSNIALYAAFKVTFLSLPKFVPDYFAHFSSGTTFRGRIYASTSNALAGAFRLLVANNTNTTELATDLNTNSTYTIVTRYNLDAPQTTLWLNPVSEASPGATATDNPATTAISSYDFRQDSGVGATILIDDFKVGLSFAAVTGTNFPTLNPIPLNALRSGNNLILSWTSTAFGLQSAPIASGPYTNVPSAASPYTNPITASPKFFRLKAN